MQWRRIVFSFVIVFGATLWALPFSASAADFCVATPPGSTDLTCPGHSTYSASCIKPGFTTQLCMGGTPSGWLEHCCQSVEDPCASSIGTCDTTATSCSGSTMKVNSCAACLGAWCVPITASLTPLGGGAIACGTGGTCQASCSATATPPTEVDSTGAITCSAEPVNNICCKLTVAACAGATPPPSCATVSNVTTTVKNPLAFNTVEGVLGSVLSTLQAIIVVLALISIVIGGILYVTSAGDDERMKTAKGAITAAAIGLALGLAAPSFLKQIGDILGWGTVPVPGVPVDTAKTLSAIALSALQFLLSIVGVLGIIMLVIGGLTYLTSAGNEEQSESGKKIVTYAIIGIAVALASLIAVTQIAGLFV